MRIVLISPNEDIRELGIRILSACLKKEGHDVKLIFLPQYFKDRYKDQTLNQLIGLSKHADLIGITVMTAFFENSAQVTQRLKECLDVPIIWGGPHPTIKPEECLEYADIVSIGEGEQTLLEIIKKMAAKQDYNKIPGVWAKHNGKIIKNKIRPLIQNLDSIPFPDYDYKTHFILNGEDIEPMNPNLLGRYIDDRIYVTISTRGCPFECTYCHNNALHKLFPEHRIIRKRSVDNIINELIQLKNLNFFKYIKFDDDAFFSRSLEDIHVFCEKYKAQVKLPLIISGATPITLSREKLSLLIEAGLIHARIGIQSASEKTKKMYKRHYSNEQIEKAAKLLNEFKNKLLWPPKYDIILDNPWETEDDAIKTLMFLTKLPTPYHLSLYSLILYPGTELYEKAREEGILEKYQKEAYTKAHEAYKNSYLNRLFALLGAYSLKRCSIHPRLMSLLVNKGLRRVGLSWILYATLKILLVYAGVPRLISQGLGDLQRGDASRISGYLNKSMNRILARK